MSCRFWQFSRHPQDLGVESASSSSRPCVAAAASDPSLGGIAVAASTAAAAAAASSSSSPAATAKRPVAGCGLSPMRADPSHTGPGGTVGAGAALACKPEGGDGVEKGFKDDFNEEDAASIGTCILSLASSTETAEAQQLKAGLQQIKQEKQSVKSGAHSPRAFGSAHGDPHVKAGDHGGFAALLDHAPAQHSRLGCPQGDRLRRSVVPRRSSSGWPAAEQVEQMPARLVVGIRCHNACEKNSRSLWLVVLPETSQAHDCEKRRWHAERRRVVSRASSSGRTSLVALIAARANLAAFAYHRFRAYYY